MDELNLTSKPLVLHIISIQYLQISSEEQQKQYLKVKMGQTKLWLSLTENIASQLSYDKQTCINKIQVSIVLLSFSTTKL